MFFSSTYLGPRDDVNLGKGSLYLLLQDYRTAIQYLEKSQIQNDDVGYMKVVTYDKIAELNSLPSLSASDLNFFEKIKQFFVEISHWN